MSCRQLEAEIKSTFGVTLTGEQVRGLETVGQLHDQIRAEFADRLMGEPVVMARFVALMAVRRALRHALGEMPEGVEHKSRLDDILPKQGRAHEWKILDRHLGGILPPLANSRELQAKFGTIYVLLIASSPLAVPVLGYVFWSLNFWVTVSISFLLWVLGCAIFVVLGFTFLQSGASNLPEDVSSVAHIMELWCAHLRERERSLPEGERELWWLYRKIVSDLSGHDPKRITRETRFADLGIE